VEKRELLLLRGLFLSFFFLSLSLSLCVFRGQNTTRRMRFPFFEPILLQREEEEEEDEEKDEDEIECALNAEINGKFLAFNDDDTYNGGARKLLPDVARVVALDNLWKLKKKKRDEEEEERRAFVKALASVNVGGQNGDKIDVRASVEKYWERETVDGSGDGDDEEKTLGAKSFVVDAASRNGGIVGEVDLFERLERVFPQTVFARAPVESFVFNNDGGGGGDGDDDDDEHRKRFKYDAIVYNASDETSTFRYHIDGCPMTLLHPQSAFAKAYGGNYANRTPMRDEENGARASVKPRFVSLLVYLNDEWDPEWGGETKFLDEDSQIGLLVAAKPGRVVLFDSDVKHSVCPTTNSSSDSNSNNNNNKRFSLVMKLIALPKQMFVLKKNEKEEEDVDLLRVNPHLGFGPATPIGSAKRLRSIVEATTRRRKVA